MDNIRELYEQIGNCRLALQCIEAETKIKKEFGRDCVYAEIKGDISAYAMRAVGSDDVGDSNFKIIISDNSILKKIIEEQLMIYEKELTLR